MTTTGKNTRFDRARDDLGVAFKPCRDRTCIHTDCHDVRRARCYLCGKEIRVRRYRIHEVKGGKAHAIHEDCGAGMHVTSIRETDDGQA